MRFSSFDSRIVQGRKVFLEFQGQKLDRLKTINS
jgi:hypothetical protein